MNRAAAEEAAIKQGKTDLAGEMWRCSMWSTEMNIIDVKGTFPMRGTPPRVQKLRMNRRSD